MAKESEMLKEELEKGKRRYYQIAGITVQVEADAPMTDETFLPAFKVFQVDGPGEDTVIIRHRFSLPEFDGQDLGKEVYRRAPWIIYQKGDSWIYICFSVQDDSNRIHYAAVFNYDHTIGDIYNPDKDQFLRGGLSSLTRFTSDQILLARLFGDRQGCYIHSSGINFGGRGIIFAGHSEAGKSTMVKMLKDEAEILCDDRIIARKWPEGFRIHGTWNHGDIPDVSAGSAPAAAILFLEQARENRLIPFEDSKAVVVRLLDCLVKPLTTADWWEKSLNLVEEIVREIPCYILRFDKSGQVVDVLRDL